jgi:hypothetical protein
MFKILSKSIVIVIVLVSLVQADTPANCKILRFKTLIKKNNCVIATFCELVKALMRT